MYLPGSEFVCQSEESKRWEVLCTLSLHCLISFYVYLSSSSLLSLCLCFCLYPLSSITTFCASLHSLSRYSAEKLAEIVARSQKSKNLLLSKNPKRVFVRETRSVKVRGKRAMKTNTTEVLRFHSIFRHFVEERSDRVRSDALLGLFTLSQTEESEAEIYALSQWAVDVNWFNSWYETERETKTSRDRKRDTKRHRKAHSQKCRRREREIKQDTECDRDTNTQRHKHTENITPS